MITTLALLLFAPLVTVFTEALRKGWWEAASSLSDPKGLAAIRLTLTVAAIAVPLNAVFGIAAAWYITKYDFRSKPQDIRARPASAFVRDLVSA